MNTCIVSVLVVLLLTIAKSFGANILFLSTLGAPSHYIWNEAIIAELLKNGHNITLLGYYKTKLKSSNYTVLYIEDPYASYPMDPLLMAKLNPTQQVIMEWDFQFLLCELDLKSDALKELMTYPRNHFDLIILDVGAGQCLYPLMDLFLNTIIIGVSPFATPPSIANIMGHQIPSYIPMYSSQYGGDMNLWERTHNFYLQTLELGLQYYYLNRMYKKSQEVFGEGIRDFHEIEKEIVMLLTNNDPILDYAQAYPPNIIPVGGLHLKHSGADKLDDLRDLLDNSKDGVIYFSLGSIVKSSAMSQEIKKMFLDVFRKLKQTVLWKFEEDGLEVPQNVIVRKWFPQNDILAHKNVVLFISHCGGLSAQEAMYFEVPVLGIPIIVDQHNNAAKIAHKGGGLLLNYHELSNDKLLGFITEIVENPKYQQAMGRLSKLFRDQQVPPLEKAVFQIEYWLRNKGTYKNDLNPQVRYMRWFQLYSVNFLIVAIVFTVIFLCCTSILFVYHKFKSQKVPKFKRS